MNPDEGHLFPKVIQPGRSRHIQKTSPSILLTIHPYHRTHTERVLVLPDIPGLCGLLDNNLFRKHSLAPGGEYRGSF